jgi:hypothetical protein
MVQQDSQTTLGPKRAYWKAIRSKMALFPLFELPVLRAILPIARVNNAAGLEGIGGIRNRALQKGHIFKHVQLLAKSDLKYAIISILKGSKRFGFGKIRAEGRIRRSHLKAIMVRFESNAGSKETCVIYQSLSF